MLHTCLLPPPRPGRRASAAEEIVTRSHGRASGSRSVEATCHTAASDAALLGHGFDPVPLPPRPSQGRSASRAHALRAASHPPPPQASGFGPPAPSFAPDSPSEDASTAEAFALARTLARVAEEGKGGNTRALHVAPLVYWTRVMVLSTVTNRPQLRAMLARMEAEALGRHGATPAPGPGPGRSTWELLDFGDVVVHLQTADQRAFYDLVGCRTLVSGRGPEWWDRHRMLACAGGDTCLANPLSQGASCAGPDGRRRVGRAREEGASPRSLARLVLVDAEP